MYSRREFGKLGLAGLPLCIARAGDAVSVGVATFSFRNLATAGGQNKIGRVIQALRTVGATRIELSSEDTESPEPISGLPKPQTGGAYGGMVATLTPEELADIKKANRANLRQWRLNTQPAVYEAMRTRFDAAGISIFSYRVDYDDAFTDDEIAATFEQAKALGAGVISSATTVAMARRLAPFSAKHRMPVAFHNKDAFASPSVFASAQALSNQFKIALDIGNFTAANQESVAYIQESHAAISHLLIKDRTRDGGANEEFGNGDTPIKPVLRLLKGKQYSFPVFVQYEYLGVGTPEQEVSKCLAYVRAAVA